MNNILEVIGLIVWVYLTLYATAFPIYHILHNTINKRPVTELFLSCILMCVVTANWYFMYEYVKRAIG